MCVLVNTQPADTGSAQPRDSTTPPDETASDTGTPPDNQAPSDASDSSPPTDATDVDQSPCPGAAQPEPGELRINELLANPPGDELGDANRDGTRDAYEDEFVEVVNMTPDVLDLTRTRLFVGDAAKVLFSDICLPPGEGIVVFGGFRGQGLPITARGSTALVSSSRLGLSNSGGEVSLARSDGTRVDTVSYSDAPPESLTRAPQLRGQTFMLHSALPGSRLMSPGQCADGALITTGCPNSEPAEDGGADAGIDGE
jgi:hypothetical protein